MSYNPISGTGNGSAPVVNLTFPFLDKSHVKALVEGAEAALTWTGASQVTFDLPVASGDEWVVYRQTPLDLSLTFTDSTVLSAKDLNRLRNFLAYRQEEVEAARGPATPSFSAVLRGELSAADGVDLVGVDGRSLGAKLREQPVSITDFDGADPTGASDSLAALNAAIATGRAIYLPAGDFSLSDTPTTPIGSFRMFGPGRLVIAHSNSPALHIAPASVNHTVDLDIVMVANSPTGPCPLGIHIEYPEAASYPYRQVRLNVDLKGDLGATGPTWAGTWGRGVRLTNVWYPRLRINGSSAPIPGDTGNTGMLEVTGGAYGMIGANISAVWLYGADFIRGSAYMEGVYINDSEAVGVTRGIYVPNTTPNGGAAGSLRAMSIFFNNSHIAAHTANVDLDNVVDARFTLANMQRWADPSSLNWTGYKLNDVAYPIINGGTIAGNDGSVGVTTLGIDATGALSAHGLVSGVHFENLDTQFSLAAATSHWTIRGNTPTGSTPDNFVFDGVNHDVEWLLANGHVQRLVNSVVTSGLCLSACGEIGITNAAGVTYSTSDFLNEAIFRLGAAAVSDTTPTAAQIVASIPGAVAGVGKRLTICNFGSGLLTIVPGSGVTPVGTINVPAGSSRDYLLRITSVAPGAEAVRLVGLQVGSF